MIKSTSVDWKTRFFTIWVGQQFSVIGSRVASFALVWWVTATTGSATVLATATLVALLPGIVLAPFVGAYVDRHNRQRIMILADGFVALVSAFLAYLFWSGHMQVWHVYLVMVARSLGETFHWPAMQASTSLMVPEEHLPRVSGANSTVQGIMSIAAPPLGAFLMAILPLFGVMLIDVVTAAMAIAPLLFVTIPQPKRVPSEAVRGWSMFADVKEGLSYIKGWPGLVGVIAMALLINLVLSPAFSLVPILVTRTFGGGASELGWADSSWGVGLLAGGLILSVWGGFRRRMVTSLLGLVGTGIGAIVIGLAPSSLFWVLLAGMFSVGAMNPMVNGPLLSTVQARVRPDMQGRVFTVINAGASAATPLGLAVAGPVADALGVQFWFLFAGLVCVALSIGAAFMPAILNMDRQGEELAAQPDAEAAAMLPVIEAEADAVR